MLKQPYRALYLFLFLASWMPASASAQSDSDGGDINQLIDEINVLVEKGERERLADPWFLRDLRSVVGKYDYPWRQRILHDDFSGRDTLPRSPWKVTAGEFLVDWRYGLRSVVSGATTTQASESTAPQQQQSSEDAAKSLFGAILQQALDDQQGGTTSEAPPPSTAPAPSYASVAAEVPIPNAFAVRMEITSRPTTTTERLELGPYQGATRSAGYALVYAPGASPALVMVAVSSRGGTSTVEFADEALNLADGKAHTLLWTRSKSGAMSVTVDGQELMRATDRSFRQPFRGFQIVNRGGDYAIRQITIDGAT